MVADPLQITGISLLKSQPVKTRLRSSFNPGLNEVFGNVNPTTCSPKRGERNRRSAISTAEVQNPQRRRDPERPHDGFSRFTHQGGNLGKVALFPQGFVWIHDRSFIHVPE